MRALENANRIREALAPPDREPSGSKSGMAAAVWLRTTVKAPAGAADGGHRLSLRVGEDGSRSALPDQRKPIGWMMSSSEDLGAALAGLERASRRRLTEHWVGYFGTAPPPRTSRWLMIRAVAYKMQEPRDRRAPGCNPSPAVRRRAGPGSAQTRASARHRADPGMARHRPSDHDCRARGDLSRRTPPLAVRGCPPDHRRPLVGAAVLRREAIAAKPPARCCAVYTRKSSEEGLEQDFNSLHAQREACEAFIRSQRSEGWRLIETAYDDGGLSGGSLGRFQS